MPVINTGLVLKGCRSNFQEQYDLAMKQTLYGKVCMKVTSDSDKECYRWLGQAPMMKEFTGARVAKGLNPGTYDVRNQKYEATLEIDRDELSDDQTGGIMIRAAEMGRRAALHKDVLLASLLVNGAAAGYLSYDSQIYFSAAHAWGSSGSQDNDIAVTATASTHPVIDCLNCFNDAVGTMMMFKDDTGDYFDETAGSYVVVCHPMDKGNWETAMYNQVNTGFATAAGRPVGSVEVFPWARCSTRTICWILRTDTVVKPFIFQDREPIEFQSLDVGSEETFKTEKLLVGCRARYAVAYGEWRHSIKVTWSA